tara:strand:- start:433 stop:699 length:267 start_codon:yes stop_codon:yes gene_type:complete
MAQKDIAFKISKMSFEEALSELEEIVRGIESGEVDLDGAIQAYERGAALKEHCDTKLREAQEKVSKIKLDAGGAITQETVGTENDPPF